MNFTRSACVVLLAACIASSAAAAQDQPSGTKARDLYTPKQLTALVQIGQLAFGTFMFESWTGAPPKTLEDLVVKPEGLAVWPEGGFVTGGKIPTDPWGRAFLYKPAAKRRSGPPDIRSLGADGKEGGEGENADLNVDDIGKLAEAVQMERGRERATRPAAMAMAALKNICVAEADFRSNDRDGNLVNDFWTGDVHALAWLMPQAPGKQEWPEADEKHAGRLIDSAIAAADASPIKHPGLAKAPPAKPTPYGGYLFVALKKYEEGGETKEYGQDTDGSKAKVRSQDKYGFAAIPADYGKPSKLTYIVNEYNSIWCKDTGGKIPDAFPESPKAAGWAMADDMEEDEDPGIHPPPPPPPPPQQPR